MDENTRVTIKVAKGQATILKNGSEGALIDNLEIVLPQGTIFGALAANYTYNNEDISENATLLSHRDGFNSRYALASADDRYALRLAANPKNASLPWYKEPYKKKVRVQVDMPWGVAAVRGTIWGNKVSSTGQSTSVADGTVEVSSSGGSVNVPAGQSTQQTSAQQPPTPPQPLSPAEQQMWTQQHNWIVNTVNNIVQLAPVVVAPPRTNTASR